MSVNIHNLIAAISPDTYCEDIDEITGKPIRKEVKEIAKKEGYLKAAETAKPKESDYLDVAHLRLTKAAMALGGLESPTEKHLLVYDAFSQNLEPIYFWILDYINKEYKSSEKLVDNFVAAAGSGYFSELQQRATRMQEEAMKIFGTANTVLRSVLNIVYDLKEFETRLELYDKYAKLNEREKGEALLSLKQIWLDSVDIKRGNSSIKALAVGGANQPNFITLIDAFMSVDNPKDIEKLDLNDRVKRILEQRIPDFFKWIEVSERELRKRFEIEKNYLKSQVSSLQIYARWIKPYLKAAKDLEQRADPTAALVNSFNTAVFELTLLGKGDYNPEGDIQQGELPKSFRYLPKLRKYTPIVIVEFRFRAAPDRSDQRGGFGYRGRAEIIFTSYSLNEDELKVLKQEIEKDDVGDMFKLIEDATTNSLGEIKADIDHYLNADKKDKEEGEKENDDINPFSALFSFLKGEKKTDKKDLSKGIPQDTMEEKVFRSQSILEARWKCRKLYNDYKKSINMPILPPAGMK